MAKLTGVAAVVDPRRDVQEYLDDAAAAGVRIDHVIETHLHADFLSGHLELAEATGATIVCTFGLALILMALARGFVRRRIASTASVGPSLRGQETEIRT